MRVSELDVGCRCGHWHSYGPCEVNENASTRKHVLLCAKSILDFLTIQCCTRWERPTVYGEARLYPAGHHPTQGHASTMYLRRRARGEPAAGCTVHIAASYTAVFTAYDYNSHEKEVLFHGPSGGERSRAASVTLPLHHTCSYYA